MHQYAQSKVYNLFYTNYRIHIYCNSFTRQLLCGWLFFFLNINPTEEDEENNFPQGLNYLWRGMRDEQESGVFRRTGENLDRSHPMNTHLG